jgi:hypothetical protein
MQRVHWDDLTTGVRKVIESQTGPVLEAETASEGLNSQVATVLGTPTGRVFIKGLRSDHPRVWTQQREAMVNPYVLEVTPRLLWHVETDGWNVLGFEHVAGRHADYSPGSQDLPMVVEAMRLLGQIPCPDHLQVKRSEQRWAGYVDDQSALGLLSGDSLLHTDYNPLNILIDDVARIVDWAWPTCGAAWIDPACLVVRLMAAGHAPDEAEAWAARLPAWDAAFAEAVDIFAVANCRMWDEIARDDPQPWKVRMKEAGSEWAAYRRKIRAPAHRRPCMPDRPAPHRGGATPYGAAGCAISRDGADSTSTG